MKYYDDENITFRHNKNFPCSVREIKNDRKRFLPKIEFIRNYFPNEYKNKKILDVGIGYGLFLNTMEKEFGFGKLYGMDPFTKSIKIAKKITIANIKKGKIENEWPFNIKFDVITCFHAVEHLKYPEIFFTNAKKYLERDGIIIISTPNKELPYLLRSIPIIGVPDNQPTHINVQKPEYWKRLAKDNGYKIIKQWKGENLSHIRIIPKILELLFKFVGVDHRKIKYINSLEQSFCMVIQKDG